MYIDIFTSKSAPAIVEMNAFEEDVVQMISNVKFRKVQDPFLNKIDKDLKSVIHPKRLLSLLTRQEISMKYRLKRTTS